MTLFIFSMSVVFLRSIAKPKFIPTDIKSATSIALKKSGNIGFCVYCGAKWPLQYQVIKDCIAPIITL